MIKVWHENHGLAVVSMIEAEFIWEKELDPNREVEISLIDKPEFLVVSLRELQIFNF